MTPARPAGAHGGRVRRRLSLFTAGLFAVTLLLPATAGAQVTPAAGYTPPDDAPTVAVHGVLFTDFTQIIDPQITDTDGNKVSASAFNVGRAYLNITGQVNHLFA